MTVFRKDRQHDHMNRRQTDDCFYRISSSRSDPAWLGAWERGDEGGEEEEKEKEEIEA